MNSINMSKTQYELLYSQYESRSKWYFNIPKAFLIGGAICALGQGFIELFKALGADEKTASTLCSVTLIFLSALLTGLRLYPKIAKHGGAGTLVPITGFSNAISSTAIEFKSEGLILGLGAKIFTIAGPVILYGIAASAVYGLIYYFLR